MIRKFLAMYQGQTGGFFTQEIRSGGIRKGFELFALDGRRGVLAHVDHSGELRVRKYGVDIDVLDKLGVGSIYDAMKGRHLVVIDEIGPMEIKSQKFREAVRDALLNGSLILGSIMFHSDPFADQIKRRPEINLLTVNSENRETLPLFILEQIHKIKSIGGNQDQDNF